MPEFEPDPESISRAKKLSSRLMQDLHMVSEKGPPPKMRRGLFSERRYAEHAEGVPINDVVTNVGQMASEFSMARRWDGEILCLKLDEGELAPISMTEFFGGSMWTSYGSEGWIEWWERYSPFPFSPHRFWRDILRRAEPEDEQVIVTNVREAEDGIERSINRFLSYRFAGMKKWAEWIHGSSSSPPPPAVGQGGGLQVQVSCRTPGLRIHISPAYFISWVFFGSPTTPVTSYVLPGRYIFAGDGPMLPKRTKDRGVFCIPPIYHPTLTRF